MTTIATAQHPDAKLTLREAFDKHYDTTELRKSSVDTIEYLLRRWERFTRNPPVGKIDNATVADFREACIRHGHSPATVNGCWTWLRAIFRRLGPVTDGNPWAVEIIDRVPAMKTVKRGRRTPYRIPLEDISRAYVSCRHAQYPRSGVPPADWWRALIVVAYTTGLRKGDLLNLTRDAFDFENMTITFEALKTGKGDTFPLHPAAAEHVVRIIRPDRERIFYGMFQTGSRFYQVWHSIQDHAGITRRFGLHDIRRTAASEVDAVERGLGKVFLQHAPRDVSESFYLNAHDELKDAILSMRLPVGFQAGPKMVDREREKERQTRIVLDAQDFDPCTKPLASDWTFHESWFTFRGQAYHLNSAKRLQILRLLASADGLVNCAEIASALNLPPSQQSTTRVHNEISKLRARLRSAFGLHDNDPVPCLSKGDGGSWTISLPMWMNLKANGTIYQTAKREIQKQRRKQVIQNPGKYLPATKPSAADWSFADDGFTFRGVSYSLTTPRLLEVLQILATSDDPVSVSELIVQLDGPNMSTVQRHVIFLRGRLRSLFGLPESFDPIPHVGGGWTLAIP